MLSVTEGRDKLFGHLGAIDNVDVKGLNGPVFLRQSDPNNAQTVADWRYQLTERPRTPVVPSADNPGWLPVTTNVDVFNKQPGWAWYQATLPALSSDKAVLHFAGVDDNATVYLNGVEIGQHGGLAGSVRCAPKPQFTVGKACGSHGSGRKPRQYRRYQRPRDTDALHV